MVLSKFIYFMKKLISIEKYASLLLIAVTFFVNSIDLTAQTKNNNSATLNLFQDTFRISRPGTTLKYKTTSLIYPAAFDTVIYFLTIQPKYKFGDLSFAVSQTGNPEDAHAMREIDTDLFRVWTVWQKIQEDQIDFIVPDNKPLKNIKVAYNYFYEYFPMQYLKPLIENDSTVYHFDRDQNTGSLRFKIIEKTNYQLLVNGEIKSIPCIKIQQSTKAEYLTFKKKPVKTEEEKTYLILNNIHDPVILKREGYRVSFRPGSNDSTNGFKYLKNDYLLSIKNYNGQIPFIRINQN